MLRFLVLQGVHSPPGPARRNTLFCGFAPPWADTPHITIATPISCSLSYIHLLCLNYMQQLDKVAPTDIKMKEEDNPKEAMVLTRWSASCRRCWRLRLVMPGWPGASLSENWQTDRWRQQERGITAQKSLSSGRLDQSCVVQAPADYADRIRDNITASRCQYAG